MKKTENSKGYIYLAKPATTMVGGISPTALITVPMRLENRKNFRYDGDGT